MFFSVTGVMNEDDADVRSFLDRRRADESEVGNAQSLLKLLQRLRAEAKRNGDQLSEVAEDFLMLDMVNKLNAEISAIDQVLSKNKESPKEQEASEISTRRQIEEARQLQLKNAQELVGLHEAISQKEQEKQVVRDHHETAGRSAAVVLINSTKLFRMNASMEMVIYNDHERAKVLGAEEVKLAAAIVAVTKSLDDVAAQVQPFITERDEHHETQNRISLERQNIEELLARKQSDQDAVLEEAELATMMREVEEHKAMEEEQIEIQKTLQAQIESTLAVVPDIEAHKAELLLEHDQKVNESQSVADQTNEDQRWSDALSHLYLQTKELYDGLQADHHLAEQDLSRLEREIEDLVRKAKDHEHIDTGAAEAIQDMMQRIDDIHVAETKLQEEVNAFLIRGRNG